MVKIYNRICIVVLVILGYEYAVLNRLIPGPSAFRTVKAKVPLLSNLDTSPAPGHVISYWLGWAGFAFMAILLLYSIRKRFQSFHKWGPLPAWLDFHIFCGLIGPILIIFHSNFKVGGLVAISFWSMVISAGSGIVGRYFYFQILQNRGQMRDQVKIYDQSFAKLLVAQRLPPQSLDSLKKEAITRACGIRVTEGQSVGFLNVLLSSVIGDISLIVNPPKLPPGFHKSLQFRLRQYGKLQRKIYFLDTYKKFMGYWHAFHLPFAVFMYVVAIIHIITALLFKVHA